MKLNARKYFKDFGHRSKYVKDSATVTRGIMFLLIPVIIGLILWSAFFKKSVEQTQNLEIERVDSLTVIQEANYDKELFTELSAYTRSGGEHGVEARIGVKFHSVFDLFGKDRNKADIKVKEKAQ